MLQFLLDTDHLTLLERAHSPLLLRMSIQPAGAVGLSAVTVEEALRGRLAFLSRQSKGPNLVLGYGLLVGTVRLCSQIPVVTFDAACEVRYQDLRRQGIRIGTQDLKIAVVALVNNLTLLTRNQRDFGRIAGIRLDDWTA